MKKSRSRVSTGSFDNDSKDAEIKGWLFKWTNYFRRYQRRWFVLSASGVLSYYKKTKMSKTCRGRISLHGAKIRSVDSCTFTISKGENHIFFIKTCNEVVRQSWISAIQCAKAKAVPTIESREVSEEGAAIPYENKILRPWIQFHSKKLSGPFLKFMLTLFQTKLKN